jgi:hypothetical protein
MLAVELLAPRTSLLPAKRGQGMLFRGGAPAGGTRLCEGQAIAPLDLALARGQAYDSTRRRLVMVRALNILLAIALVLPSGWCCLPLSASLSSSNQDACQAGGDRVLASAPACCRGEDSGNANKEEKPCSSPEPSRCDCQCSAPRGMIEASAVSRALKERSVGLSWCSLHHGEYPEAQAVAASLVMAEAARAFPEVRYQILYCVWRC